MSPPQLTEENSKPESLRRIAWWRRGHDRKPTAAGHLIHAVLVIIVFFFPAILAWSLRLIFTEEWVAVECIILLIGLLAYLGFLIFSLVWMLIPGNMERYRQFCDRLGSKLIRGKPTSAVDVPRSPLYYVVSGLFILCWLVHWLLTQRGILPWEYYQPIIALYLLPFLASLQVQQRVGWWTWLFIVLYGLHSVAVVAGAPIQSEGENATLWNIALPLFGYMFLSILVGTLHSRFALSRLKKLEREGKAGPRA